MGMIENDKPEDVVTSSGPGAPGDEAVGEAVAGGGALGVLLEPQGGS